MVVFRKFLVWPKFYLRIYCAVCRIVLYCTVIYWKSIVSRSIALQHTITLFKNTFCGNVFQKWIAWKTSLQEMKCQTNGQRAMFMFQCIYWMADLYLHNWLVAYLIHVCAQVSGVLRPAWHTNKRICIHTTVELCFFKVFRDENLQVS